jgi:septal ring factor EnvC (AmiA/AmiB activator)
MDLHPSVACSAWCTRLASTEALLESKVERLKQIEQDERSLSETVTNMKQISETTSKKLDERTRALDSAQAQVTELQLALEKAWKEVADQKKISSGVDSKAEQRLQETQQQIKDEYEEELRYATAFDLGPPALFARPLLLTLTQPTSGTCWSG